MFFNESIVENATLTWLGQLGYVIGYGTQIAPGEPTAERDSFGEVVLVGRLRDAIRRLILAISSCTFNHPARHAAEAAGREQCSN